MAEATQESAAADLTTAENGGTSGANNCVEQPATESGTSNGQHHHHHHNENVDDGITQHEVIVTDGNNAPLRQGSISSARFNILCTMVGGGCLSLPMAFQKTGNGFLGPLLLILTAAITEFCFRIIITATRRLSPVNANTTAIGKDSFETMASAAFGPEGFVFAKWLVTLMCFFGIVGYSVLLRDMLQPITDAITRHHQQPANGTGTFWDTYDTSGLSLGGKDEAGPSLASNLTMLTVVLFVTPICTLRNLSSLEKLGAASMSSILILGGCIVYRSCQCNFGHPDESFDGHTWKPFKMWPDNAKDVLDAFPLFVSCYVSHYNIPAVHNELQNPTPERVNFWLRSTTMSATIFYLVIGLAGSAYGHCTPTGKVHGNVLIDFDEDDPMLLVARMCLACTITLAFPLLVIPARDILLRSWFATSTTTTTVSVTSTTHHSIHHRPSRSLAASGNLAASEATAAAGTDNDLREPLLANENNNDNSNDGQEQPPPNNNGNDSGDEGSDVVTTRATATAAARSVITQPQQHSFAIRLGTAILVLWSATALACCVSSIDVVWDLLGSSLSIVLSYLIPCGVFVVIVGQSSAENDADDEEDGNAGWKRKWAVFVAKAMICVYVPLMAISTGNAFYDTFFK